MTAPRLAMVELLDRDGGVAHRVPVTRWPVTIGRSLDCDVVLDDPHVAPLHATLNAGEAGEAGEAGAVLHVGDTRNGVRVAGQLLAAGAQARLASGAPWHIGRSALRVRLAGETLAAEVPMLAAASPRSNLAFVFVAGLALLLWLVGSHWLQSDPGDRLSDYLPVLVGTPATLGVWCFLWALGSKVFARHFDFLSHLRLALGVLLISLVLDAALPLLAFATSWGWLVRAGELVTLALGCRLIYGHLGLILPTRRRALAVGFATMFVVGAGLKLVLHEQRNERWFDTLYVSTLGPPGWRLAPAVGAAVFIEEARQLRAPLEKNARSTDTGGWLPVDDEE